MSNLAGFPMRVVRLAAGLLIGSALLAVAGPSSSVMGSEPTVQAIQTHVAVSNATAAAAASPAAATAAAAGTSTGFDFVDPYFHGTFHITVDKAEPIGATLYDQLYSKTLRARGRFVALTITMVNTGSEPVSIFAYSELLLRDDKGRAFSYDTDASSTLMFNRNLYVSSWQPSLAYDGVIVYDVAKDARGFSLEVKGTSIKLKVPGA